MSAEIMNSSVISDEPSEETETIFLRLATFLSCSSCFLVISSTTSCGERPGQAVVTEMIGRSTVGVSWMGMAVRPIRPNMTTRITPTATETGLAMESLTMSMGQPPRPLGAPLAAFSAAMR